MRRVQNPVQSAVTKPTVTVDHVRLGSIKTLTPVLSANNVLATAIQLSVQLVTSTNADVCRFL